MKELTFFPYMCFLIGQAENLTDNFSILCAIGLLIFSVFHWACASLTMASICFIHLKMDYHYTCTHSTINLLVSAEKSVTAILSKLG